MLEVSPERGTRLDAQVRQEVQRATGEFWANTGNIGAFSLDGDVDEPGALVNVVRLLIELQRGFVLGVVDVDDGAGVPPQQSVHGHAQLHVKPFNSLKHFVIADDDGAHLGVLALVKLDL